MGRDPGDHHRTEQVLAVVAELPEVCPEDENQADRDQQQRCRQHRAVLPGTLLNAVLPDALVELDRVRAEEKQQHATGDQGEEYGHD